jgi:predicted histone-like DNA-binding protein
MAVKYELYRYSGIATTEIKKRGYFPRVVNHDRASLEDIVDFISSNSTYDRPTIVGAIEALGEATTRLLKAGKSVHIPGFGTFNVSAKCEKPILENNGRNLQVKLKDITFRPDAKLWNSLADIKFVHSTANTHADVRDEGEWEQLVTDYFKTNRFLTLKGLQTCSNACATTCWKRLRRWESEGKLVNVGPQKRRLYERAKGAFGNL